jgi:hypothetical protein
VKGLRVLALTMALCGAPLVHAAPLIISKITDPKQAFDELTIAAANHGYTMIKLQPIDSAMKKRGYEDPHVRLFFIGSAQAVKDAEEQAPMLLQLLPLRVVMVLRKDEITLMSDDFEPWRLIFSDSWSRTLLNRWEADMSAIFTDFAGRSQ